MDETKVVYQIESSTRVKGLFTFEYATGTVTRIGKVPAPKWHDKLLLYTHSHSPDHKHAIQWENGNELILFRKNQKPKSLGKDFKMGDDRGFRSWNEVSFPFPVLWLDNGRFLTQHDNGKLVTVDTDGKLTDVATIKDVPAGSLANLYRDRSGAIIYSMVGVNYKIDIVKKTAEKSEWYPLGNGFEVSYEPHKKLGYTLRHSGKPIGQFSCLPFDAKTLPGYLALPIFHRGKRRTFISRTRSPCGQLRRAIGRRSTSRGCNRIRLSAGSSDARPSLRGLASQTCATQIRAVRDAHSRGIM